MPDKETVYAIQSLNETRDYDDRVRRVCRHKNRANEMAPKCLEQILREEVSTRSRFGGSCYYDLDLDLDSLDGPDLDWETGRKKFKEAFDFNLLYTASRKKSGDIIRVEVIERDLESLRKTGEFELDEEEGEETDEQKLERECREDLLKKNLGVVPTNVGDAQPSSKGSFLYLLRFESKDLLRIGSNKFIVYESKDAANEEAKKKLLEHYQDQETYHNREDNKPSFDSKTGKSVNAKFFKVRSGLGPLGLYAGSCEWYRNDDCDPVAKFYVSVEKIAFVKDKESEESKDKRDREEQDDGDGEGSSSKRARKV